MCLCWVGMKWKCRISRKTKRTGPCCNWRCNLATRMSTQWSDTQTGGQRKLNFRIKYDKNVDDFFVFLCCSRGAEEKGQDTNFGRVRQVIREQTFDSMSLAERQFSVSVPAKARVVEKKQTVLSFQCNFWSQFQQNFVCRSAILISLSS